MMSAEKALASRRDSIAKKIAKCLPTCPTPSTLKAIDDASCAATGPNNESLAATIRNKIHRHERMMRSRDVRSSMKDMKHEAYLATRSIYGVVLLAFLPAFGILLIGLTISWNTINVELRSGMVQVLEIFTAIFQMIFAFIAVGIWDGNQFFAYTDAAICLIAPFADWYWFLIYGQNGKLTPGDVTTYCLLIGYMTARAWSRTVQPRHSSWRKSLETDGISALDGLDIVWVSRSASLVSELMPDINNIYEALAKEWGRDNAAKVCKISVYVTDKDEQACNLLRKELASMELYRQGAICFGRPNFARLIENHALRLICTRKKSYSLLTFCGSHEVARELQHHKISNDMITAITGNKAHQMEYVSESYGGCVCKRSKGETENGEDDPDALPEPLAPMDSLTTRTVVSYYPAKTRKFLL